MNRTFRQYIYRYQIYIPDFSLNFGSFFM